MDGLDKLNQFPILQLFGGLVVLGGVAFALFKGHFDRGKSAPPEIPEQRWYFDGPIAKALETLQGIYRRLGELIEFFKEDRIERREQHNKHMEAVRDLQDRLPPARRR